MIGSRELIETAGPRSSVEAFARDVLAGLSATPKSLSSAYFYDARGSQLFQQITELDEYYLTGCEREILQVHAATIADWVGDAPLRLVEAGAGDGHKTEILLQHFHAQGLQFEYVPIDICQQSVVELLAKLRRRFNGSSFQMRGLVADYFDALNTLRSGSEARNLVLFLGSSIGNFDHREAKRFLRRLRKSLNPGDLALIGFDLKKDPGVLQRAYDDSQGITREFNFNLLDRINRELGGRFDRRKFTHHASYNVRRGCMESALVSRCAQQVPVAGLDRTFSFGAWEGIHVERSYKYDTQMIAKFAEASGFRVLNNFTDERGYFIDSLWQSQD